MAAAARGSEIGTFESDRLVLRPITLGDINLLVELDSDPDVMRYLTGRPSTTGEVEAAVRDHLGCRWVASEKTSGEFVGWFGLVPARKILTTSATGFAASGGAQASPPREQGR